MTQQQSGAATRGKRPWLIVLAALVIVGILGSQASLSLLGGVLGLCAVVFLLRTPYLGLFGLIVAALAIPIEISTGTEVSLNPVALLIPSLVGVWLLSMTVQGDLMMVPSRVNSPLLLLLLSSLFSLFLGIVLWDVAVPRSSRFVLVQLAQWAIIAFSTAAFFLAGNLIKKESRLRQLTFAFLILCGGLAFLYTTPELVSFASSFTTLAFIRAPLWMLLTALAAGQLLFNPRLGSAWRIFLLAVLGAVLAYSVGIQQEVVSNWVGILVVLSVLAWLRWPRLRWPVIILILLLTVSGFLLPAVYELAGGNAEWMESGGSRLALIARVLEITWQNNPITGLGPAAYRPYGFMEPLRYEHIVWVQPRISSHNNYVDLFGHFGIVGLSLFFWFVVEVYRLGLRLRHQFRQGFAAGYVNGMLATGAASLVIMLLADWILPFVYNIGFPGFQASVLVWVFMGGLVSLEQIAATTQARSE